MNILFIGPYRQSDGWGLAARDYISCLNKLDNITLSCIPIYMSNNIDNNIPNDIMEIEQTYCNNYDVIIQNVLPNYFEKHPGYNIGIYYSETYNLNKSIFIDKINLLDELWVSSESEKQSLKNSGVIINIKVLPIPINTKRMQEYKNIDPLIPSVVNDFNFYILSEYTERKNIEAAVIAFNREFSNNEQVNLIIKTKINGLSDNQNQQNISNDFIQIKYKLRLYNRIDLYPNEMLISQSIDYKDIMRLHKTGNCLLVPSRGEAYCKPALEALYFGNKVLCTEGIYTVSILGDMCTTVKSMEVPIFINHPPAPHIYTGWETWNEISILDLQQKMRKAMTMPSVDSSHWVENNFSYEAMSKKIGERLCQL